MIYSAILSIGNDGQLGLNNSIPWKLKEDLNFFKQITLNHIVVFGRKTFESINKPLKNRINVILTKNLNYKKDGCIIIHNIEDIKNIFKNEKEIFICGGSEIYKYFFENNLINKIYLTKVDYNGKADTFLDLKYLKKFNYIKIQDIIKNNNNEYNAGIFILKPNTNI